jgi:hypothetical protein
MGLHWHWFPPDLPKASLPMPRMSRKCYSCTKGLSLTIMVSWQNLQRRLFRDSLETRGEIWMDSPVPDITKVTKAKRFWRSDITQVYWTFKPLQAPLTEGKLIFFAKVSHLSKKQIIFAGSKLIFLVVHAHGVIFP